MGLNLSVYLFSAALLSLGVSPISLAQTYPSRPITIIVPAAAGGVLDVEARKLRDELSRALGQTVIVENRPGASGFIGAEAVAGAKPDGYTVLIAATNVLCINPVLYSKIPYDPIGDFAPVSLAVRGNPVLLVNLRLPVKTLPEFVDYAKARPGRVNYGSPNVGSPQHIAMELLKQLAGIEMTHVPYKNGPQVMADLIGGQIDAAIEFPSVAAPYIKAGKVRALAIVGPRRAPIIPDVPTAAEVGLPAFDLAAWHGFLVPAGTPKEIIGRLNKEIVAALKEPESLEWETSLGNEVVASTPEEFADYIKVELARWSKIVHAAKIQLE
jgi:tripartite-type tricarboxylate transporter receptor subunit TctC